MAYLYRFVQYADPGLARTGGIVAAWNYTDDLAPVVEGAVTYQPAAIKHDALELSSERNAGQMTVRVARDNAVGLLFRDGIPSRTTWLSIRDSETGAQVFQGRIRTSQRGELEVRLLCASLEDLMKREGLRLRWSGPCWKPLYSAACGVNRDAESAGVPLYRTDAVLASVSSDGLTLTAPELASRPDGFFTAGTVEVAGQRRTVLSHVGSSVVLMTPIGGLSPGAPVVAYKGCNHGTGAGGCLDFNNRRRFGGTPNVKKKNIFLVGIQDV